MEDKNQVQETLLCCQRAEEYMGGIQWLLVSLSAGTMSLSVLLLAGASNRLCYTATIGVEEPRPWVTLWLAAHPVPAMHGQSWLVGCHRVPTCGSNKRVFVVGRTSMTYVYS